MTDELCRLGAKREEKKKGEDRRMKKNLQTRFSTRQYMLSRDFEIYYYSDHTLSKVESHTHTYYEFYFFLEGNVSMEIGGKQYPLKYGDVMLIPPGMAHRAVIHDKERPYRRFVFWISQDYCMRLAELSQAYGYLTEYVKKSGRYIFHNDRISFNTIQMKVFRLIEEIHSQRYGKDAKVALCVNDLVLHLNRRAYEQNHPKRQKEEKSLYESLLDYVEEHLEEDLTLEKLSREFYVSKYHIAHIFKDNFGMSIHQYIMKKRVTASRDAMLAGEKITEAYLMYGFKDYSSFFRAFKKEYGMSPKEYVEMEKVQTEG